VDDLVVIAFVPGEQEGNIGVECSQCCPSVIFDSALMATFRRGAPNWKFTEVRTHHARESGGSTTELGR
jgi:hypothetical protein